MLTPKINQAVGRTLTVVNQLGGSSLPGNNANPGSEIVLEVE